MHVLDTHHRASLLVRMKRTTARAIVASSTVPQHFENVYQVGKKEKEIRNVM